jgi:hypothetical protein
MLIRTDYRTDDYRDGRKRGLRAVDALAYARDLRTLRESELEWYAEPDDDEPGSLCVFVADDQEVTDVLCGVELAYWISDHGNVHYDERNPYLVGIVAEMIRGER